MGFASSTRQTMHVITFAEAMLVLTYGLEVGRRTRVTRRPRPKGYSFAEARRTPLGDIAVWTRTTGILYTCAGLGTRSPHQAARPPSLSMRPLTMPGQRMSPTTQTK